MNKELYDLFDKMYGAYEACIARHLASREEFIDARKDVLTGEVLDEEVYKDIGEEL